MTDREAAIIFLAEIEKSLTRLGQRLVSRGACRDEADAIIRAHGRELREWYQHAMETVRAVRKSPPTNSMH